jgi:hypothetical protein
MRSLYKIIYYTSICYIVICCLVAVLLNTLPLEFKSYTFREHSHNFIFFGIPIAIFFTTSRLGFIRNTKSKSGNKIRNAFLISAGVFALFFVYAIATFGGAMCDTTTGETLFIRKNSSSSKIVTRYFGCGATDSSPASVTTAKQLRLFHYSGTIRQLTP